MVDIESHAGPENQVNIFTFFFLSADSGINEEIVNHK